MELTTSERVVKLLNDLGVSKAEFSRQTGISTQTTSNLCNNTKSISSKIINLIKKAYPEVNTDYLMNGTGNPILSPDMVKEPDVSYDENDVSLYIQKIEEGIRIKRKQIEEDQKLLSMLRQSIK